MQCSQRERQTDPCKGGMRKDHYDYETQRRSAVGIEAQGIGHVGCEKDIKWLAAIFSYNTYVDR